jgi:hypothetical protein
MKKLLFYILTIFSILSCTETNGLYSVSGQILLDDVPVSNATVTIDNSLNWSTSTDKNGNYIIKNVNSGKHNIVIRYSTKNISKINTNADQNFIPASNNDSISYVEINKEISVYQDLILASLKLPKPVIMLPISSTTESSIVIKWSATDAEDFREYKLFRHLTSGLDETTGELVHVSTSRNDTVFTDTKLTPLTNYYYRVYIMNDYGKLGGSNIVSSQTLVKNYIINGDFESGEDILSVWKNYLGEYGYYGMFGKISFSDSIKKNGNRSLFLTADKETDTYGLMLTRAQIIVGTKDGIDSKNKKYKISFWIKTSGEISKDKTWFASGYNDMVAGVQGDICMPAPTGIKTTDTDWTYVEDIIPTSFCGIQGIYITTFCTYTWIDDLKLEDVTE